MNIRGFKQQQKLNMRNHADVINTIYVTNIMQQADKPNCAGISNAALLSEVAEVHTHTLFT